MKICYNRDMNTKRNDSISLSERLFGKATPSKTSGVAYSVAALLPGVAAVLVVFALALCGLSAEEYQSAQWYAYFGYLLPQFCYALVVLWVLFYSKRSLSKTLVEQKCSWRYFAIALLLQCGLFAFAELNTLFLEFLQRFGYTPSEMRLPNMDTPIEFLGVVLAVAVLPAIFEEVLFRGILLNGIKGFGVVASVLLCGALFALYHQNPPQTVYQFACGAAFAVVALRSGSVLPTIVSHFCNNLLVLILYKIGLTEFSSTGYIVYIVVSVVCLAAATAWLIFDRKKTEKRTCEREKEEGKTFFKYAFVGIAVCAFTWLASLFTGM